MRMNHLSNTNLEKQNNLKAHKRFHIKTNIWTTDNQ